MTDKTASEWPRSELSNALHAAVACEAVRLYERYAVEVVEEFDLCPWAARARRDGAVRPVVLDQSSPEDLVPSLVAIDTLARLEEVTIGILLYPRLSTTRLDFEHFLRRLRRADSERHPIGEIPFAMAAFHPQADADTEDADRLVPFIRRTPDPTLQLVRRTALQAVQANPGAGTALAGLWMVSPAHARAEPERSVRERIALRNLETVRRVGPETLEAVFQDIAQDRASSYGRLRVAAAEDPSPEHS